MDEADFTELTAAFTSIDEWLRKAKTRYGMRFAEAGLDVAYDAESRARYAAASTSDEKFEEFLDAEGSMQDAVTNFEF